MAEQKILLGNVRGEQGPAGPNTVSASTTTSGFENGHVLFNNNGKVGAKKLSASDVGARPSTWKPSSGDVSGLARGFKSGVSVNANGYTDVKLEHGLESVPAIALATLRVNTTYSQNMAEFALNVLSIDDTYITVRVHNNTGEQVSINFYWFAML